VADPIADKALTGVALLGLSLLGELSWWATVVILGREVSITLVRFLVIRHGVIPASRGGKAKTVSQMLAILLYIVPVSGWIADLRAPVMLLAVVLTVVTGIDYVVRAVNLRSNSERTAMKRARRATDQ
jgi:CDP-diacylglycerol--glycerol-3-phosphate 3-phosphatidyltransferase